MIIAVICGTRPEIIKLSPVIRELNRKNIDYYIIHTGQHYSYELDGVFFDQLNLPRPRYNLMIGSCSSCMQLSKMIKGIEETLLNDRPDVVLVLGDTNTVLAGAFVANRLRIAVGHIEAGLRSYDKSMPEELNRVLADRCSDYLFAPTNKASDILIREGIQGNIYITGNTVVDAVNQNIESAHCLDIKQPYFLATVHRTENVDNSGRFSSIIDGLKSVTKKYNIPIVFPIHPHSCKEAKIFGINLDGIEVVEPMDYLTFLGTMKNSKAVLTDSGGVQEESCIIGVPCVTLRDNTERPETIEVGSNVLAGVRPDKILECVETMLNRTRDWANPFGDGMASNRIVEILSR